MANRWPNRIVEYQPDCPLREFLDNERNWRIHPEAQRRGVVKILDRVGKVDVLKAYRSKRYGGLTFYDGHLRRDIDPNETWPVIIADLTDEEADFVIATFDAVTPMVEIDYDILDSLVEDVGPFEEDIAAILATLNVELPEEEKPPLPDPGPQVDRAEELQEVWQVETGQVWEIPSKSVQGKAHLVMCGDSTNSDDVDRLLDGEKQLLMITDPPYGVNYDPNWRNEAAENGLLSYADRRVGKVVNDDRADWSDAWLLFPGDVAYTWSPPGDHVIVTGRALQSSGYEIRAMLMWKKPHIPIGRGHYCYQHEPVWYAVKKGKTAHWIGGHMQSSVWEIALDKNVDGGHSTQKPVECFARPMRNHEGNVYDPFLGSGTAIVACEQTGRIGYGMEISPAYVAVCLQRFQDAFGVEPVLVE